MTATTSPWIALDGAVNCRDLGGLPTTDGGRTAHRQLLRSDNLQDLSAHDVHTLVEDWGVAQVIDLRTFVEVDLEGPGPLTSVPAVTTTHLTLYPEVGHNTDATIAESVLPWQSDDRPVLDASHAEESITVRTYLGYLQHRPDHVAAALRAILAVSGASLVNCAAGKDRTGVVCALALSVAGVQRAAIVDDYARSGEVIEQIVGRLAASPTYAEDNPPGRPVDSHRPRPETMRRFLEVLDERYGGVGGWLTDNGFGPEDQAHLKSRLVAHT